MLVLARKPSEWIQLRNRRTGEIIKVTNVRAAGSVSLGFDADSDWEILRGELVGPSNGGLGENRHGDLSSLSAEQRWADL